MCCKNRWLNKEAHTKKIKRRSFTVPSLKPPACRYVLTKQSLFSQPHDGLDGDIASAKLHKAQKADAPPPSRAPMDAFLKTQLKFHLLCKTTLPAPALST